MPTFFHFFVLSAIVITLAEEAPPQGLLGEEAPAPQALAPQETKVEAANQAATWEAAKQAAPMLVVEAAKQAASPQVPSLELDISGKQEPSAQQPQLPAAVTTAPAAPVEVAAKTATEVEASKASGAEPAPGSEATASKEAAETAKSADAQEAVKDVPPRASEGDDSSKENEDDGMIEVSHSLSQNEAAADVDNMHSLAALPMFAALLSFAGILGYSLVFLCKIFSRQTKSQGLGLAKAATAPQNNNHEELDFEDLEGAAITPVARKRTGTVEEPRVPKEEAKDGSNCWETAALSDDGWGDDAWGNDGWDDLEDCEGELNALDASITSAMMPSKPAPLTKGKAD